MIGTILRLLRNVGATSLRSTGKQQPDVAEQSREPEHAIRRLEMEAVLARARLRQVVRQWIDIEPHIVHRLKRRVRESIFGTH